METEINRARPADNIHRFDYSHTHGWTVRYMRDGAHFQRLFSDGVYGSSDAAHAAAEEYFHELVEAFPPMNRQEYAKRIRRSSASGIIGVRRVKYTREHLTYWNWVAFWSPRKGKTKRKYFAVLKYGEEEAKRLAIEARKKGLEEMELEWPEGYAEEMRQEEELQRQLEELTQDLYGHEGTPLYEMHLAKERDRALRKAKIKAFLEAHGELYCELCSFSFEREYGTMGTGLIEVHHLTPMSELTGATRTHIEDLMLICPNCHFVLHAGDPHERLQKLGRIFSGKKGAKKRKTKEHPTIGSTPTK